MDLEITTLSEVSQTEKDKYHDTTYMWNLKKWYNWTYLQNRNTHRLRERKYGYQGESARGGGGIDWEFGIDMYTLL